MGCKGVSLLVGLGPATGRGRRKEEGRWERASLGGHRGGHREIQAGEGV